MLEKCEHVCFDVCVPAAPRVDSQRRRGCMGGDPKLQKVSPENVRGKGARAHFPRDCCGPREAKEALHDRVRASRGNGRTRCPHLFQEGEKMVGVDTGSDSEVGLMCGAREGSKGASNDEIYLYIYTHVLG